MQIKRFIGGSIGLVGGVYGLSTVTQPDPNYTAFLMVLIAFAILENVAGTEFDN